MQRGHRLAGRPGRADAGSGATWPSCLQVADPQSALPGRSAPSTKAGHIRPPLERQASGSSASQPSPPRSLSGLAARAWGGEEGGGAAGSFAASAFPGWADGWLESSRGIIAWTRRRSSQLQCSSREVQSAALSLLMPGLRVGPRHLGASSLATPQRLGRAPVPGPGERSDRPPPAASSCIAPRQPFQCWRPEWNRICFPCRQRGPWLRAPETKASARLSPN